MKSAAAAAQSKSNNLEVNEAMLQIIFVTISTNGE
jgi:hypothetical protein